MCSVKPREEQNLWSRAAEGQWGGGKGWRRTVWRDGGRDREFPGAGFPRAQSKDSFEKERAVKSAKRNGVVKEDEG